MNGNPLTYGELYNKAVELLNSKFEAGQLFTHVTQKRIFHMSFLAPKPVPANQADLLLRMCRRRVNGEPLQYLLGEWEFFGLPFKVGKGVLIPRADTESLVETALEITKDVPSPVILDLCSGTGCVAIAINHNRTDADVTALEISDEAFVYLTKNIALNHSHAKPVKADLKTYVHPQRLDLLVSNPPYIPKETIAKLQPEVRREPLRALDGGVDGLDFYRLIAQLYHKQLVPGGHICLEVGIGQSEKVSRILEASGFADVKIRNDYTGIPRVVSARK